MFALYKISGRSISHECLVGSETECAASVLPISGLGAQHSGDLFTSEGCFIAGKDTWKACSIMSVPRV